MSLVPHSFFPRSMFDMDQWMRPAQVGPSTLDLFDPFDELDHTISRNLQWLNRPEFMPIAPLMPRVPQKYRITVDCAGFSPNALKVDFDKNGKLVVHGHEEHKESEEDYSVRNFKKVYDLPENVEREKMVTFLTQGGKLVIEMPLRETPLCKISDLLPQIVEEKDGKKSVQMKFHLPKQIDPSHCQVSVKDRDVIIRAEDSQKKPDRISNFYYYKRTTLPENTNFDQIKCVQDENGIKVSAPLDLEFHRTAYRSIPIEHKKAIKQ